MNIFCSAGKGELPVSECLACALMSGGPDCGYDYALLKAMFGSDQKSDRASEIHVTDLTGCVRKAWYDKVEPPAEFVHEKLVRWMGSHMHGVVEGTNDKLDSELHLSADGVVGTADIVYKDGRVVDLKFCQPAGEWVTMADGTEKQIQDIKIFDQVLSWNGETFVPARVTAVMDGGIQEVYEITGATGIRIRASEFHPILTDRGWVVASQLIEKEDRVSYLESWTGGLAISLDDARLIGYLVGDGNTTQKYSASFCNYDEELVEDARQICLAKGWGFSGSNKNPDLSTYWRLHNNGKRMSATGPISFVVQYGLYGKHAWEKSIPDEIMRGNQEVIANFLAGYFDTDGTITDPNSDIPSRLSITTTSERLAYQTSDLLRRIGITNKVYPVAQTIKTEKYHQAYGVQVHQARAILRFGDIVPFRLRKKRERLDGWRQTLLNKRTKGGKNLRRIERVVLLGKMQTIGIEIEGTHTYLSSGIVTHNSRWIYPSKLPYGSHSLQVNVYAWMLRQMGREVNRLQIQYIDASGPSKCRKCRVPVRMVDGYLSCPKCHGPVSGAHLGAVLVDVALLNDAEVLNAIQSRKEALESAIAMGMAPAREPGFLCSYCASYDRCQPDISEGG